MCLCDTIASAFTRQSTSAYSSSLNSLKEPISFHMCLLSFYFSHNIIVVFLPCVLFSRRIVGKDLFFCFPCHALSNSNKLLRLLHVIRGRFPFASRMFLQAMSLLFETRYKDILLSLQNTAECWYFFYVSYAVALEGHCIRCLKNSGCGLARFRFSNNILLLPFQK